MGTSLHLVHIESVDGAAVIFTARRTDAVALDEFFSSAAFGLMVVHEATRAVGRAAPLLAAVGLDVLFDEVWLGEHVDEFVASLELLEEDEAPVDSPPCARYRVLLTDPCWARGIVPGTAFDSAAYDV